MCIPYFEDFEDIVMLDKRLAKGNKIVKSHTIAIYLNKSAPRSKQSATTNGMDEFRKSTNENKEYLMLIKQNALMQGMNIMRIEPRKRWNKLYDRNLPFKDVRELLSVEISNKITLLRNDEGWCFPLIWNEPGSSNVIDEVSGENLCHITLLCRDVICECNTCTTGCTRTQFSCESCKLDLTSETLTEPNLQFSGSFAEYSTLPIFHVQTDGNNTVKKCSDIDMMAPAGERVGFGVKESNIVAIVDMDKSRPGYLQLRNVRTGKLCRWPESSSHEKPDPSMEGIFVPSCDTRHLHYSPHGPATSIRYDLVNLSELDRVFYMSCSSWPPIGKAWIDRKRPFNWPSKETIQTTVSKGCRIVHKPHELSENKDTEFRFSFSEAERILFVTLTRDQRKGFIAFKALIKNSIYKLENKTRKEINFSSYNLKTIFLWTCESFPSYLWQTTNGWSRCLLYMIDLMNICLKIRILPGYFIPESNLLDALTRSRPLLDEIAKLKNDPLPYAATFIDATKCFHGFQSKIYDDINILCGVQQVRTNVLTEQLIFLQRIVAKTNVTRGCLFWKKEAVLRIFAKWCKQNSNEIRLALWQCLTNDMTLFDIVYLDIVHGFDVPNNVLLKYVDKGWSADFVCRLGSCYNNEFNQGEFRKQVKYFCNCFEISPHDDF